MRDCTANHVPLCSSGQKVGSANRLVAMAVQELHPGGARIDLYDALRVPPSLVSRKMGG
jgi:hypothetical protein